MKRPVGKEGWRRFFYVRKKKNKISENCLKVRDLVAVGSPASCELQQHSPATGREQLAIISWRGKKKNNPNAGKKDAFGGG